MPKGTFYRLSAVWAGERSESAGGGGQFLLPAGIATDIDGRIYVADQFYRKIDVFRPVETPEDTPLGQPVNFTPL